MNPKWQYDPDMPIDTIMTRWPATIEVILRNHMLCIGCPIGGFHTIGEACAEHGIDEAEFVMELEHAVDLSRSTLSERDDEESVRNY